ncbi:AMP-binding protein [Enteractinococcus fodinae]|uniref:Fatty-acyl-CoA synthase n=1 Tax=Enteractinococcus fodinae TaxID=684663 RepID=A0ABU2B431_9MICC|nr:AMP-binding protein [Enteractinococcus fodinae]MDR7348370.1 fatty-acyl-CoA synthase [Enteractinococcus fodinae]
MNIATHLLGPTQGVQIKRALERYPERLAFKDERGEQTYAEVYDLIGRYQAVLEAAGLKRGDGVAALGANRFEVWVLGSAVQSMGLYITWLHPMGSLADQKFQVHDSQVKALIVDETYYAQRGRELAEVAQKSGLQIWSMSPADFASDLATAAKEIGPQPFQTTVKHDDLSTINYTGGTTGKPKGAYRKHFSLGPSTADILANFELPDTPRYLLVPPMSHVAGTNVLPTLIKGGTVHLMNGFDPAKVLETIEREKINFTLFVPTMIYALLDHPDLDTRDTSSLEYILYGASPMSESRLREGMERIGPVFGQLYGQTECYPVSILSKADHQNQDLLLSCGKPVESVDVRILAPTGEEAEIGEPGELCVRGRGAMQGYWQREDLTAETIVDGWIHTGDIAKMDEQGYLYIVDRKKDMIISGGFNVFPREVEDALTTHPAVAQAAVFGIPDEKWGEQVTAAVILKSGHEADSEELVAHVKELKGSVQTPKEIIFPETMPQTAVGKINKRALRDLASNN